jgi:hypothetical protein
VPNNATTTRAPIDVDAHETTEPQTQALVHRPASVVQAIVPRDFAELMSMSDMLAGGTFISVDLRGRAADIAARIGTGAELGLPPYASLRNVYIGPGGKPGLQVAGKLAAARRSGLLERLKFVERNDQRCTVEIKRRGEDAERFTYTMEDAARAGLTKDAKQGTYEKIPTTMLQWRAIGTGLDVVFADVLAGVPDEYSLAIMNAIDVEAAERRPAFTAPDLARLPAAGDTQAQVAAAATSAITESRADAAQAEKKTRGPKAAKAEPAAPPAAAPPAASEGDAGSAKPWPRSEDGAAPAQPFSASSAAPTTPAPAAASSESPREAAPAGTSRGQTSGPDAAEPVHAAERAAAAPVTPPPKPAAPAPADDQRPVPPMMAGFREALRHLRRDHANGMSPKELGTKLLAIKDEYVPWSKTDDAKAAGWHLDMRQEYAAAWADVGAID